MSALLLHAEEEEGACRSREVRASDAMVFWEARGNPNWVVLGRVMLLSRTSFRVFQCSTASIVKYGLTLRSACSWENLRKS